MNKNKLLRWAPASLAALAILLIFTIPAAVSAGGLLAAEESSVNLSLWILPEYRYKDISPGEANTIFMEVRNNGESEITDISFSADIPEGWAVKFVPESISSLSGGSSQAINITVTPEANAKRGDYTLTFIAKAAETQAADSTTLRVENGSLFWVWVGGGVAAAVIAGFVLVFLRYGK